MKNIAIFINELSMGGIQKSCINMIKNLDKKKYNIDLYIFKNDNFFNADLNVNIITLKKPTYLIKFIPFDIAYKLYNPELPDKEYDISIDFDTYQMHTTIASLKVKAKKYVTWIHNDIKIKLKEEVKYKILHFFFQKKYVHFDSFCAVSKGALEGFLEVHPLKDKECRVIPNYIDTSEIKEKMKKKVDLKVDKKKVNIVTVGRLTHQKGIDIMLHNIQELLKYRKDFHLYIIGDGEEKEKLLKLRKDLELEDYVTFLGSTNNPFQYLNIMDLFYLSSRYEGQGMVILEALAVGIDVLIPKHLEKYCDNVEGQDDVVEYLKKYKRTKENKFDPLTDYNHHITKELQKLFEK